MKKNEKYINYAKTLYTKYDKDGNKVYSLRDIAIKLKQECNKSVTYVTVARWAKKYDWDKLNEKIKRESIEKAKDKNFSEEELIIEAESDKMAIDYKNAENLANIGYKIIIDAYKGKEHELISVKEALVCIKTGMEIKFKIQDIPDTGENLIKKLDEITKISFIK